MKRNSIENSVIEMRLDAVGTYTNELAEEGRSKVGIWADIQAKNGGWPNPIAERRV